MIVISRSGIARAFACAAACLIGASALSAQVPRTTADYDSLINHAIDSIQAGNFGEAAQIAREAIDLQSDRYEGHLYLGISRFRQDATDEAERELRAALDRSPADRKPKVQEALELVVNTRKFRDLMALAEEAERDGARAKSARTYAEAWWLVPDRVDVAVKALQGLIATQNDFEAARIWNTLTAQQKTANTALFRGIAVNAREVSAENERRRPALQDAIKREEYGRALELGAPMAQADPGKYAVIVGVLLFLNQDRAALRWSSELKPDQLVRMDFFSEAQMNNVVHGQLFRSYLEDVVGGSPERTVEGLQVLIEKPGKERLALAEFQNAFLAANKSPDTDARIRALQNLRSRYPGHAEEIARELTSAAELAKQQAADSYRALQQRATDSYRTLQLMTADAVTYGRRHEFHLTEGPQSLEGCKMVVKGNNKINHSRDYLPAEAEITTTIFLLDIDVKEIHSELVTADKNDRTGYWGVSVNTRNGSQSIEKSVYGEHKEMSDFHLSGTVKKQDDRTTRVEKTVLFGFSGEDQANQAAEHLRIIITACNLP